MNQQSPPIFRLPPYTVEATFVSLSETVDWGLSAYHIPELWKLSRGNGVRVAVLDTGIDEKHPDLIQAIENAKDFTGSRFGPIDRQGHGTHVSGTIAARQNDTGIIGVAPDCQLLVGKVLGDDGSGSEQSVTAGIDWAVEQNADVISMSLGSPVEGRAISAAIRRAAAKGKFVICAAGNDGRSGDNTVDWPGRMDEVVAVAAVNRNGQVADFSSRGPQVDIAAPGQDVLSCYLNGQYAKLSGTSMATPFVSGVVALMLAKRRAAGMPSVAGIQALLDILRDTAKDAGPVGYDPAFGWGLIDPTSMLGPEDVVKPPPPVPSPVNPPLPPVPSPQPTPVNVTLGPVFVNGVKGTFTFKPDNAPASAPASASVESLEHEFDSFRRWVA